MHAYVSKFFISIILELEDISHKIIVHTKNKISESEDTIHHPVKPIGKPDDTASSGYRDDYLLTFVLPAVIIVVMLLLATIIACVLHRRRMTGKMELGK